MMRKFRDWLLQALAGSSPVGINLCVDGKILIPPGVHNATFINCNRLTRLAFADNVAISGDVMIDLSDYYRQDNLSTPTEAK
jgi:hypothetical protein